METAERDLAIAGALRSIACDTLPSEGKERVGSDDEGGRAELVVEFVHVRDPAVVVVWAEFVFELDREVTGGPLEVAESAPEQAVGRGCAGVEVVGGRKEPVRADFVPGLGRVRAATGGRRGAGDCAELELVAERGSTVTFEVGGDGVESWHGRDTETTRGIVGAVSGAEVVP